MSGYVSNYDEMLQVMDSDYYEHLENTNSTNFFTKLHEKSYSRYLARYYYNKAYSDEYERRIIVVPKNGYITQRLVYLNDSLVGGTKVGTQAINITEQDGSIQLRNSGAVGFCPLGRFFDSLCYAFGIEVDKNKINIYELCNSVLQNFEFVYNRETGLHIDIHGGNFNNVHVLYIVEDEKTYFDEDLVQAFANTMYNAGWFTLREVTETYLLEQGTYPLNLDNPINSETITSLISKAINAYPDREYVFDISLYNQTLTRAKNKYPDYEPISIKFQRGTDLFIVYLISKSRIGSDDYFSRYKDKFDNYYCALPQSSSYMVMYASSPNGYRLSSTDTEVVGNYTFSWKQCEYANVVTTAMSGYDLGSYLTLGRANTNVTKSSVDGITVIDGAKIPTGLDSLSVDYPNWFSRLKNMVGTAVETAGETLRNVFKVIEFVPLTLIGEKPTEPDNPDVPLSQDTTQTGVVLSPTVIGTLPEYTVKYLTPLPDTDTPISPTSPYYPDNPDYPSDTPTGNPSDDPANPPAIGGVTPPVPDNPIVNASNGLFTVYNPTMEQLNQFGGYLWGEDIVGILQSIFQNPIDGVISLHILYATPETGDEVPIKVGYLTSTVSAKKVVEQYINIDCGTVNIPEYYGNVLDYSPFTKAHIYLPFIGIREINVNEIMGGQVNVNYKVDVLTGSVYASISVFHNAISQVLYVFEGNGSVQLPLTGGNMSRILSGVVSGVAFGALTGGVTGAVVGATGGLLKGASVSKSGSVSSNAGAMGIKYPYIMITHSQAYMANNYNTQYGYPSNLTTQLSACKGYTRVKEVHVENILVATQEEKDMIQTLLRQGVIIE